MKPDQKMRNSMVYIDANLNKDLVGVEIGVWRGQNASIMFQNMSIKMLYLIDSYVKYTEYNHNEISSHIDMDANQIEARDILRQYEDKTEWIIKKAHDAINDVPNELDLVYIDGNHAGQYCATDIEDWYPKIRSGGILAGHDIWKPEIATVVRNFGRKYNYFIDGYLKPDNITWDEAGMDKMDFWITKR